MLVPATTGPSASPSIGQDRRVKLLVVVSSPVPVPTYAWIARSIDRDRFDISFLLPNLGPATMEPSIRATGVPVRQIPLEGRLGPARATLEVARYCREHSIDVIHVHMERALMLGLLGAKLAGVPVRLHTRHIAGPYPTSYRSRISSLRDLRNNGLSTHIVAPSEMTRHTLEQVDQVPESKISVIPHGFDLASYVATDADAARMRTKLAIGDDSPIVGVVSRFLDIKGIDYIIDAFRLLLQTYPRARLVLANARGHQETKIRDLLERTIPGRYTTVVFETDMAALYRTFDVFVHVPVEPHYEAFGQVYVEALAAGIPSVFTLAGAAGDFIVDGENALVVPSRRSDAIHQAVVRLLGDDALQARLSTNGRRDVKDRFSLNTMIRSLEDLYLKLHHAQGVRAR
jgi:glycosyltransferase involved in cell wall biosynthesis